MKLVFRFVKILSPPTAKILRVVELNMMPRTIFSSFKKYEINSDTKSLLKDIFNYSKSVELQ